MALTHNLPQAAGSLQPPQHAVPKPTSAVPLPCPFPKPMRAARVHSQVLLLLLGAHLLLVPAIFLLLAAFLLFLLLGGLALV